MIDFTSQKAPELVIVRTFRAPRELVWKAWADPQRRLLWMGPRQHPARHVEGDFRVGGAYRCRMEAADGSDILWHGGVYHELVEPERMVFTFAWDGDDEKPENEMLITLTFTEEGAGTKMTFHQVQFNSPEQRDRHREGWTGTFDRLAEYLDASKIGSGAP